MRTKASAVKTNESVPVFRAAESNDVMSDGTNLRGEPAIVMFERNFKRSRLGNATLYKDDNDKSNVDVITDNHKKEKQTDE